MMKNNLLKKVCAFALCCTFCIVTASGCTKPTLKVENTASFVWSTHSTAKVTQNVKSQVPYEELDASIKIQMMKNEVEGAQLIITAGDKDISFYNLLKTDLVDSLGNKILKEDISVYHQKYLEVARKTDIFNTDYVAGDFVPDMLLPLDTAIKYKENNIVKSQNQGITVEVSSSSETVPGIYTGIFTLKLDDDIASIPVTVEVWDIEYEGRREFKSSFLIYRNSLVAGEYEASDELVNRYIDFLLDYKINTYIIKDSYSTEELVEDMIRLYDNENFNSMCIPNIMQAGYTAETGSASIIIDYITEVVKISTPEKPYIDYLYIYPTHFDEADMFSEKYADVVKVFKQGGEWDKTLQKAIKAVKLTKEYEAFDAEFKAHIDEKINNIPAIFTNCKFVEDWVKTSHVTFCPYINMFDDNIQLQKYEEYARSNNAGDLWTYTCIGPTYPNPTFHIDDYNLGTRVSGWMQKKFNVNGYLYWAINLYESIATDPWREVDVYGTAERASYCGGDGFLMYPGAYYGSEYPFASIRLSAWRDSMDDYDMISVYEKLLKAQADKLETHIDTRDYLNDLYDSLFAGTEYYTDDSLVVAARAELANRILALKNDGIMVSTELGKTVIYSDNSTLKVDAVSKNGVACGQGFKFEINNPSTTTKISINAGEKTYAFKSYSTQKVVSFADNVSTKTTDGSTVIISNGVANVNIVSVYKSEDQTIDGATQRFSTYAQFGVNGLTDAKSLNFSLINTGDTDVEVTVRFVTASGPEIAGSAYVKVGSDRNITINLDKRIFTSEVLSSVTAIRLAFRNVTNDNSALMNDRQFSISDIWVTKN